MRKIHFLFLLIILTNCISNPTSTADHDIFIQDVLTNDTSFYYLEHNRVETSKLLPIGIFDSGIGGLTVFDAIINSDNFNNLNFRQADSIKDFSDEYFIYLADQANMPYSNYVETGRTELLQENILKDAIFLLNNRYSPSSFSEKINNDKLTIKALVIACNTATAFGKDLIEDFFKLAKIDIKVLGVVDAGVSGALEGFKKDEDGVIAVFATPATVKSEVYINSLKEQIIEDDFKGNIKFVQQGGKGLHESIDHKEDFIRDDIVSPQISYKGPSLSDEHYMIDKNLLQSYNFDTTNSQFLYNQASIINSDTFQINSVENYVRYHIVSLVEKIRASGLELQLKSIILGCTHYPYVKKEIAEVLSELREKEVYRNILSGNIRLIDPADKLAIELYEYLADNNLLYTNALEEKRESSFYITVPNIFEPEVETTSKNMFTYDFQYLKREINSLKEFTLTVPFSRAVISDAQLEQIEEKMPATYEYIAPGLK